MLKNGALAPCMAGLAMDASWWNWPKTATHSPCTAPPKQGACSPRTTHACLLEHQWKFDTMAAHTLPRGLFFCFFKFCFWSAKQPQTLPNLACFSPTGGPCQVVNLKASNFACMAAMPCCITQNWGLCHKTQIVSPTPAIKLGSRCALLAQHTQFAQDIRLPPTQSRNTTFTELWITIQPKAQNEKHALTI
jgi:hypothetical protein